MVCEVGETVRKLKYIHFSFAQTYLHMPAGMYIHVHIHVHIHACYYVKLNSGIGECISN